MVVRASWPADPDVRNEADRMKYLMSQQPLDGDRTPDSLADGPAFEELVGMDPVGRPGHSDRWLGLAIAVATAVIGFGFAGRSSISPAGDAVLAAASSAPSSTALVVVTSPAPDRTNPAHESVSVVGLSLDDVHLTIGRQTGRTVELMIDGSAPSTAPISIQVRTRSGRALASVVIVTAVDDERPASDGGQRVGLGTFHERIAIPGPIPADGWEIAISAAKR
jgi:hypothetical protein